MKIAITGATGLIGKQLTHALLKEGHQVIALARSPEKLPELPENQIFTWSDDAPPQTAALQNCDAVIHLAGEGIADKRWTESRKKRLWDSRISGTKNIVHTLSKLHAEDRPKILISGSAIGYYNDSDSEQTESSSHGQGFLSELCQQWENSAMAAQDLGVRTVFLRTGLVLAREGGVLSKTAPVILGSGSQWMSWVHIDDVIRLIVFALKNDSVKGPLNLTAPNPVTNTVFTKTYSKVMGFPLTLKAPAMALKVALGELSSAVLSNQKVLPQKALSLGFKFTYTEISDALENLLGSGSWIENSFSSKQFVPMDRKRVFSFFSKAENLEILTPPWLNFHIQKKSTPDIQKGTLIDYKLKIHGVPMKWRTIIHEWNPDDSFVDFQLKGPYSKWHHLHTFEDVHGGTLISDQVTFIVPGWFFGKLLLPLVKKDVQQIFKYRQSKIKELTAQGKLA